MAVREALASDPGLALDVLLPGLLGQVRGNSYSWQQAAEITAEKNRFHVDEAIMGHSTIADIDEIAGADLARLAETPTLDDMRSEEHTSELQSLMRISYAVFCLKNKKHTHTTQQDIHTTIYHKV